MQAAIFRLVLGTPLLCADIVPHPMYGHVYMLLYATMRRDMLTCAGVVLHGRVVQFDGGHIHEGMYGRPARLVRPSTGYVPRLVSGAAVLHDEVVPWSTVPGQELDQRRIRVGYMYDAAAVTRGFSRGTLHFSTPAHSVRKRHRPAH